MATQVYTLYVSYILVQHDVLEWLNSITRQQYTGLRGTMEKRRGLLSLPFEQGGLDFHLSPTIASNAANNK